MDLVAYLLGKKLGGGSSDNSGGDESTEYVLFDGDITMELDGNMYITDLYLYADDTSFMNDGQLCTVIYDGDTYPCAVEYNQSNGFYTLGGALDFQTSTADFSEYPFVIILINDPNNGLSAQIVTETGGDHYLRWSIGGPSDNSNPLK